MIVQLFTERLLVLLIAAPLPVVLPFASTRLDIVFVVPATKTKIGRTPPPLMTVGTSVRPMMVMLFVIAGNCDPSVIIFVTANKILFLPGVVLA